MPERIISRARPQTSPVDHPKGRILMRIDSAAIGRFTRADLSQQGYDVTSVPHLTLDVVEHQHPDTIVFFQHSDEPVPLDTIRDLPLDVPVIVATVGNNAPDRQLIDLAERRGFTLLNSRLGPNLHVVLRTLQQITLN